MFSFLIKVITSWQVIVVSITLIIYIKLVSYVAKTHQPRSFGPSLGSRPKKSKKEKAPKAAVDSPVVSDDDDLGVEE